MEVSFGFGGVSDKFPQKQDQGVWEGMVHVFRDWRLVPGYQLVSWWPVCLTCLGLGFLFCEQQVKLGGPEIFPALVAELALPHSNSILFPNPAPFEWILLPSRMERRPVLWTLPACRVIWKFCAWAAHLSTCPSLLPTHTSWHCILFLEISTEAHFLSPPLSPDFIPEHPWDFCVWA